jgi:hypothetical protein
MKTPLALSLVCMVTASVYALPDYEPFADATASGGTSYTIGANLIGQTDALGQSWFQAGPTNATQPKIVAGNLTYANLPPSQGNSASFGGNGASARLNLSSPVSSGTIYYSFLMNVSSLGTLPTTGVFWAGFNNTAGSQSTTPSVVGTRLYARSVTGSPGVFQLGTSQNSATITWDTTDSFSTGNTLFIVGSYTFNTASSTDDLSQMWINPDPTSVTPPAATISGTGTDLSTIASFVLFDRIASEPTGVVDELRVDQSWANVVPEPTTAALAGLGLLALICGRRWVRR